MFQKGIKIQFILSFDDVDKDLRFNDVRQGKEYLMAFLKSSIFISSFSEDQVDVCPYTFRENRDLMTQEIKNMIVKIPKKIKKKIKCKFLCFC